MADLKIESRRDGTVGLLDLVGEARLETAGALRVEAKALYGQGARQLLVGVRRLGFVDSASMGVLLELKDDWEPGGGAMVLHGVSPRLAKTLASMGLAGRFTTAADEASARALLPPSAPPAG